MKHRGFLFLLFFIYMVITGVLLALQGKWVAPDLYILALFGIALLVHKARSFILDWLPFLFILISYDYLRGFADDLSQRVHFWEMIHLDTFLFGVVPSVYLQAQFFKPLALSWYDYFATALYMVHFALPLGFGFFLWYRNRHRFKEFMSGLMVLSYSALLTYILFPAAPPWMASEQGLIGPVQKVLFSTTANISLGFHFPTVYDSFNPNPVAAIPSLHSAYPFIVFLFALRFFKQKAWLLFPYVVWVWMALVYFGEHYVTDVIVGIIYAYLSYWIAVRVLHHYKFGKIIAGLNFIRSKTPKKLYVFNEKR